ncbi:MAG: STAS domain-containing protein [Planctomycetaceae bacterium]|nr:STAS domain-containing protein [Planctomycetales bacterium]MCB9874222.1 STAS domain-containing protein [Planctomycetaceae bacterium]MCB9940797.1 STAS domain-containing protein [Planctomycetaceae bacterium]
MASHHRLDVSKVGGVSVVRFVDRRILDASNIEELGDELFALVEADHLKNLLLNFTGVEFLSSAALNKLIILDKKVKSSGGKLVLCDLRQEIKEVFAITRLDQLFSISNSEQEGLAAF